MDKPWRGATRSTGKFTLLPFERLKKEGLSPLKREYIIDKSNLRRIQKDCLISYAGNQYSVPAEYVGKDVAVVALDSMLDAYYEGKQSALHRISYQKKARSSIPSITAGSLLSSPWMWKIPFWSRTISLISR